MRGFRPKRFKDKDLRRRVAGVTNVIPVTEHYDGAVGVRKGI